MTRPDENERLSPIPRVHAQVLLSRALVATSFPVVAAITHGLEPELQVLVRFALAALLFAPYLVLRHGFALPGLRSLIGYAAIGGALVTFFWCMFAALRLTTPLNAAALHTLVPGITAIYAAIVVRERLGKYRVAAVVVGLIGALWVVFRGDPARLAALSFNDGDLIFLAGTFAMGLYTPLVRYFHRGEPAAVMTFWTLTMGAGWLLLFNNAAIWRTDWAAVELSVYGGIAYLAVFTTIITFFIMQHATLYLGPTRVASYGYLTPTLVVLIEWAAGHGLPSATTLIGVVIIFAAMLVLQRGARDAPAHATGRSASE